MDYFKTFPLYKKEKRIVTNVDKGTNQKEPNRFQGMTDNSWRVWCTSQHRI